MRSAGVKRLHSAYAQTLSGVKNNLKTYIQKRGFAKIFDIISYSVEENIKYT